MNPNSSYRQGTGVANQAGAASHTHAINRDTCSDCGLCAEVCPVKIMKRDGPHEIVFRPDRQPLCIRCGQCMAVCPTASISVEGLSYARDYFDLAGLADAEAGFWEMIARRRSIRNFADKPVPRELLEKIVQAITFAPPSFPPIKTEIVVVQDTRVIRQALPDMIKMYADLVRAMRQPVARWFIRRKVGEAKFRTIDRHLMPLMKSRLPELQQGTEDTITRAAPAMIVFHANQWADNHEADSYIALTYGWLAAQALGLGATAIDLIPPAIERSAELRRMFCIPEGNRVTAALILGYPKYRYRRGIRREMKSVTWI